MSRYKQSWLITLLVIPIVAASARPVMAQEEANWTTHVDAFFGTYLVKPLQTALFFDFGTSKFIKINNAWEYKSKDAAPSKVAVAIYVRKGGGVKISHTETANGETTEREFDAASIGELRENKPDGYAIFEQYAVDANRKGVSIPFVVVWLLFGAAFFTVKMGFINVRGFWHAIRLTKGDYDDPNDTGEVSHFQALSSALSATVGLGNIAGVAIAIGTGGPGATFWMIVIGFLGMSTKFTECTLGQMYRKVDPDGTVSGGPMRYLKDGLAELGLGWLGTILAIMFAIICIGASFGGGNAFQVVQSLTAIREEIPLLDSQPWIYGLIMAVMVGVVIIGGIKSIGAVAGRIVPFMCAAYVLTAIYILATNASGIPGAFERIWTGAMSPEAMYGGLLGVLVIGIQRAVFSNEAGAGSAAIAHSAAKTDEPVSEGIVALLEPFIDTVVVCTMTALVIVITGVYEDPAHAELVAGQKGAALTSAAFQEGGFAWFRWILYAAVVLFAYSTLISWSYYGERCFTRLFGNWSSMVYKILFLIFTFLGSVVTENKILAFSDLLILGMAFPNILGLYFLSGKVKRALDEYWEKYKNGKLEPKGG
jgi:AGCS family alanine or glycine:cation symporter